MANNTGQVQKKFVDQRVGKGGWKCDCCGPAPGAKRDIVRRQLKRQFKQITNREIRQEISDYETNT